jgi:hypothetical protein
MNDKIAVLRRAKSLPPIATDEAHERRLHLRAHRYWASLLQKGQPAPAWHDFDPLMVDDRCTQSFVLDVDAAGGAHGLRLIGPALKAEGGIEADAFEIGEAPQGSLLMRLASFVPELIKRAVPLAVEAPFETTDGRPALYRGMLMPFTADGRGIDTVFAVVSWRELAPADAARPSAVIIPIR